MEKVSLALQAGRNLKVIIKERGLTQAAAAKLISVEERTLRRYLHDGIDSLNTLERICENFDIELKAMLKKD